MLLLVKTVVTWELLVLYLTSLTTKVLSSLLVMMQIAIFELLLEADVDVDDVEAEEGTITVYTAPTDLHKAIVALRESGVEEFQVTELEMIPQSEVELSGEDLETFEKLYSVLEDDEDVQKIYTNVDGF